MPEAVIGWDVGGANVKAARLESQAGEPRMVEAPLPLWREPQRLGPVLQQVARQLGAAAHDAMAVTMTAELADCFASKREGVNFVLDAFEAAFPGAALRIYGVDGRFRPPPEARRLPLQVAAANWMAAAAFIAGTHADAIVVDVGSTTTDVIAIVGGGVDALGRTDPERLSSGELVYTGALRTPISAIVRSVPWRGRPCRVAAEHFAVAADVHLWLGRITAADYTCDTPDGRSRARAHAGARLARMVCGDLDMLDERDVTALAEHVSASQARQVAAGIRQVRRRLSRDCPDLIVAAGQGAFLARAAARILGLKVEDLADTIGAAASRAAPAVAVAWLLMERLGSGAGSEIDSCQIR